MKVKIKAYINKTYNEVVVTFLLINIQLQFQYKAFWDPNFIAKLLQNS